MRTRGKDQQLVILRKVNLSVVLGLHREAQGASLSALPVGGLTRACFVFSPLPLDVCKHTFFHAAHSAPLAQGTVIVGVPRNLPRMAGPLPGDRILVLRPHWLNLILAGEKTLEIRGRNLSAGNYWLGTRGMIHGCAMLEPAMLINTAQAWQELRHRHRVESNELPYKTTYALPVRQCRRVTPIPYVHPRGAVGIVKYR